MPRRTPAPPPNGHRLDGGTARATGDIPGEATRFTKGARPPVGRPFVRGAPDPRREMAKGKAGRKPDAFKAMCRELASDDATLDQVRDILGDKAHPHFMSALKWASEYGYGKPAATIDVTSGGQPLAPGRLSADEIAAEVDRIVARLQVNVGAGDWE